MASINEKAAKDTRDIQNTFDLNLTLGMVANNLTLQLKGKPMYVPCWCGNPGMGKTAHAKIIAEQLGLGMLYFSMNKPYEALTGLPAMNSLTFGDDENRKNLYVFWSEPELIHLANEIARDSRYKGCLIFLDDMHIMSPDVQKCFFEFILERKLGNHHLDQNCCILGAMNSSNLAGFDGFFSAINNRIQKINVQMPFKYWYENCGAELNPLVAGYVRSMKGELEEKESVDEPFATYRSWSQVSDMMNLPYESYLKNKDATWLLNQSYMIACGFMSKKKAVSFKDNIRQQLRYNFESMVHDNKYHIDKNDPISQFCFGNVVRYLRNTKDADNLANYIFEVINNDPELNNYQNAVLNIMYELVSFCTIMQKKGDAESKERLQLSRYLQQKLFREGKSKVHKMMATLTNKPYESDENVSSTQRMLESN